MADWKTGSVQAASLCIQQLKSNQSKLSRLEHETYHLKDSGSTSITVTGHFVVLTFLTWESEESKLLSFLFDCAQNLSYAALC
jgi:hypothetical protein